MAVFCAKIECADSQRVTIFRAYFPRVKKAERVVSPCNKAVIALRRRPYCKAKRPSRECREGLTAGRTAQKRVSRKQRGPRGFSISWKNKKLFFQN